MKNRIAQALILFSLLPLFASCGGTDYTGSISFYDGETLLGTLTGKSGTLIEDDETLKNELAGYEVKTGYQFDSWHKSTDFSDAAVKVKAIPYSTLNLYGHFLKEVTVTLDANGGTFASGAVTSYSGVEGYELSADFPTPSKSKSSFEGWYVTGSSEKLDGKFFFPAQDETLVANYTDWPTLTVVFNIPSMASISAQFEPGTAIPSTFIDTSSFNTVTRTFEGFYEKADFSGTAFDFSSMPETSTTIYAKFSYKHTIAFVTNVTGYTIDTIYAYSGHSVEAPSIDPTKFVKAGYYFGGWYKEEACTNKFDFITMPDADLTLYAKWTADPVINLFRYLSDTDTYEATACYVSSANAPSTSLNLTSLVPSSYTDGTKNYVANGFFTLSSGNKTFVLDPTAYILTANASLYVNYVYQHSLTVSFASPFGKLISGLTSLSIQPGNAANDFTEADLTTKISTGYSTSDYKLESFSSTYVKDGLPYLSPLAFPYGLSDDAASVYAILAKKTTISLYYLDASSAEQTAGTLTGYQSEALESAIVTEGTTYYSVNGVVTAFAVADYNYYGTLGTSSARLSSLPTSYLEDETTKLTIHFQKKSESI